MVSHIRSRSKKRNPEENTIYNVNRLARKWYPGTGAGSKKGNQKITQSNRTLNGKKFENQPKF